MRSIHNSIKWGRNVKVIKQDDNILALCKPCGVLSHPNDGKMFENCIINSSYDPIKEAYLIDDNGTFLWLLNRLDSATSGILLLGTSQVVADAVKHEFAQRRVSKTYAAMVFGQLKSSTVWTNTISSSIENGKLRSNVVSNNNKKLAITQACALKQQTDKYPFNCSLIELCPKTGFTHQLRLQCALNGLPIVGDKTYGSFERNKLFYSTQNISRGKQRLCLHSQSVEFQYCIGPDKQMFTFSASSPLSKGRFFPTVTNTAADASSTSTLQK